MEFHKHSVFHLLVVSSLLCSLSTVESIGSALFIDSQSSQYLRSPSTNDGAQSHSMLPLEVGAAVSVLLGFAPTAKLSDAGSAKLNEFLVPNPFKRPRAVFMLEVTGVNADAENSILTNAFRSKVITESDKSEIELPAEEVSIVSLDEKLTDFTDKELSDLASWLGGSYFSNSIESHNPEFIIPLGGGPDVNLLLSEKADRDFVLRLLALFHNSRRAIEMHEDLSHSNRGPAELIMGHFDGIKVLKYQQRVQLLLAAIHKMVESFQAAYKGQIVGVIFFNDISSPEAEPILNVMLNAEPSRRWLEESTGSNATDITTLARVALVTKTLAWLTGIILIISTLIGMYFLLNMPLTSDTLLYSNVKLD